MAFRTRGRFRTRRGRFGGRGIARKEPIWIATAFDVTVAPSLIQQALFQLVGPEDYTPDYTSEPQRLDKCTLVRTVGSFNLIPLIPDENGGINLVSWKAALFVAGDKQIDDSFAADPTQFNIIVDTTFPPFCRDFAPMHIFWQDYFTVKNVQPTNSFPQWIPTWIPPSTTGKCDWDVTVKRKMQGDDALFLLINVSFLQFPEDEFGGSIAVEARNLIMDQ